MTVSLLIISTSIVATIVGGSLGSGPPAFRQRRSLNGITLCPFGKGKQEFGYIEVGPVNKYFYAAMEADEPDPSALPRTFIYMAGGPGGSSLNPLTRLHGPCRTTPDGKGVIPNEYSWTKHNNGIWVDAPGPTGFSEGQIEATLEESIEHMATFIDGVLKKHLNLNKDVHLVGSSASGMTAVTRHSSAADREVPGVERRSQRCDDVMMYSGVVGPYDIFYGSYKLATGRKLLPQEELDKMHDDLQKCKEEVSKCNANGPGGAPVPDRCEGAVDTCEPIVQKPLEDAHISLLDVRTSPGEESKYFEFTSGKALALLNNPSVKRELGVTKKWKESNNGVFEAFIKYIAYDGTYYVAKLLDHGLKVLVVNGDVDYLTSAVGTREWLFKLKGAQDYGEKLEAVTPVDLKYDRGGLLGKLWALTYSNRGKLAFIEVTGGSHRLIRNKPDGMQQAFLDFTRGGLW
ncbi:hypothetical protein FOZ60_012750 [Perkinsus olseni]|uniref:Thymus-specific serine protease n=1 Tax=Perkinsus olseni TaxID=32597 RepID=A0A7J6NAR4_PEROL|nr:hypothetical protein FOZ60_012750 [Perkinsus olseni]